MTTLSVTCESLLPPPSRWEQLRSAVFWGAIAVILISPAVLSAVILLQG